MDEQDAEVRTAAIVPKVVTHNMCPKCKMHERKWIVSEKGYQCTGCWLFLASPTRAPRAYSSVNYLFER
jgi:hypothetical protein